MAARPLINVYSTTGAKSGEIPLPPVFTSPLRHDLVRFVHTNMNKNKRQAYAVNIRAGKRVSASSWGTGRAVARIPRVGGGGTSRSGQGAFGNMCRGGRMFAPTKTWRKWHRRINTTQKRYAVAAALAATAVPALVMSRGHIVDEVPEIPLVLEDGIESTKKTSAAKEILLSVGAFADVEKAADSKKIRAGKGKARNRRYVMRRGPLLIYSKNDGIGHSFRNLPGVEICCVDRLNLLQLAPGGHMGRFCVWTQSAVEALETLYGDEGKKLPNSVMSNADLARIINSDEVQSLCRPKKETRKTFPAKRNPLKRIDALEKLDPYAAELRRQAAKDMAAGPDIEAAKKRKREKYENHKKYKKQGREFIKKASIQGDVCKDGFNPDEE